MNFVKQYAQFGLSDRIPLFGAGFLTEGGVLKAQGKAAEGVQTALHYAASLDNEANTEFAKAYQAKTKRPPTVYAMQTWDAAEVLSRAVKAAGDDLSGDALAGALEKTGPIDNSPRGPWSFEQRSPKQSMYLREVCGGREQGPGGDRHVRADHRDVRIARRDPGHARLVRHPRRSASSTAWRSGRCCSSSRSGCRWCSA